MIIFWLRSIIWKTYTNIKNPMDETLWLEALISRNNVPHAYNAAIALDIVRATKEKYFNMFQQLKTSIEENWL